MNFKLTDFLISLCESEGMKKYQLDPDKYMTEQGLSEKQKAAVRSGEFYRLRILAAQEMTESLHGKLITSFHKSKHPESKFGIEAGPSDVDTSTNTNHNFQDNSLGDDIAEFTQRYNVKHFYDHLFEDTKLKDTSRELVFVGSGINAANHLTSEAIAKIKNADWVLYCVADLAVERRILLLNSNNEDLYQFYADDKPRKQTYEEMVERILEVAASKLKVCVVFYGHPGMFVWPSYRAIQIAHKQGIKAYMLPAVSSLDCLFADVGFDPSRHGCQLLEATDMLVRSRRPDITSAVVIFQPGCVGDLGYKSFGYDGRNIPTLAAYLAEFYGEEYKVILYEGAQFPVCSPLIEYVAIADLKTKRLSGLVTLYIPPMKLPEVNVPMLAKLGLESPTTKS